MTTPFLAALVICLILGSIVGVWLTVLSINFLIDRGRMDIFYGGERAEQFRMW